MPLSEDEERILHEIAQQFYADDPEFAREVGETTLYTHTVRRMKWSGFGFVAGVVFLVVTLSTSYLLAFAGFLMMLGCALYFERNLRKLGKADSELPVVACSEKVNSRPSLKKIAECLGLRRRLRHKEYDLTILGA